LKEKAKAPPEVVEERASWPQDVFLWPLTATRLAMDAYLQWLAGGKSTSSPPTDEMRLPWTTPNVIALQLSSMRLRDFSRGRGGRPLLVCAPYALHSALMVDFASGHSLVQTLQQRGKDRIYVTDWRSAELEMRYLSIDSYLADLNVAVDEIGPPVDLVGLCQGGWLSLIFTARFPAKVRRLVLVGAPVDVSVQSELSAMVAGLPKATFEELVHRGEGILSGKHVLRFWSIPLHLDGMEATLQRDLSDSTAESRALLERFERWDNETLDLPGTYYLEVTDWIFRENRIAEGRFMALGHKIDLGAVQAPVFLLAGAKDVVVPLEQAFATARLLGTPSAWLQRAVEPCGHLGLVMGCKSLRNSWHRIAWWLETDTDGRAGLYP
jgi:poly(3-hydroxyalkanoate) synthetase